MRPAQDAARGAIDGILALPVGGRFPYSIAESGSGMSDGDRRRWRHPCPMPMA